MDLSLHASFYSDFWTLSLILFLCFVNWNLFCSSESLILFLHSYNISLYSSLTSAWTTLLISRPWKISWYKVPFNIHYYYFRLLTISTQRNNRIQFFTLFNRLDSAKSPRLRSMVQAWGNSTQSWHPRIILQELQYIWYWAFSTAKLGVC